MSHKCLGGCGKYIGDDRRYCTTCERNIFGNGGMKNGKEMETLGKHPDNGDEPRIEER